MNSEWSLDILYKGYEDENFKADNEKLKSLTNEIISFVATLSSKQEEQEATLLRIIPYLEEYEVLASKLSYYMALRQSTNTTDSATVNYMNQIDRVISDMSKPFAIIDKYIANIKNLEDIIKSNDKLQQYDFMLTEIKEDAKYLLSDDVEEVIAKLNLSAGSAFSSLHEYLTSTLDVEYLGNVVTLSEIRNLANSKDSSIRKSAYEAEIKAYSKIKDPISFSLNNIKVQVSTLCNLRGYASPLDMTLKQSRMKKETLNAMLEAMKEFMPKFHVYLKRKAKLLGHTNGLPWYDLFAPMGESQLTFTVEEAKEYLLKHFGDFSQDMVDMVKEAFDNEWIDFYPRKGKVGGAFCENLPFLKQSRILANFDGTLSDVVTLAHELGHAYHGMMIENHLPLNTDYSMPVAETASTFNETIIMNAAIKEANEKEKITLIESVLQDATQIICDIYSRFLFESAVFEKSKSDFLFADELAQMMTAAQIEAYGDGLDKEFLHPYMWVNKGHYYSEALSFYNFPYAFGGLFARGLYEKYRTEGETFLPKYRELLRKTTISTVEEAGKTCDINLEDPEFFRKSFESYAKLIDEFIMLTDDASELV